MSASRAATKESAKLKAVIQLTSIVPLEYVYCFNLIIINQFETRFVKRQLRDLYCQKCKKQFLLHDIIHSKFYPSTFGHQKRHLVCALAQNLVTIEEIMELTGQRKIPGESQIEYQVRKRKTKFSIVPSILEKLADQLLEQWKQEACPRLIQTS